MALHILWGNAFDLPTISIPEVAYAVVQATLLASPKFHLAGTPELDSIDSDGKKERLTSESPAILPRTQVWECPPLSLPPR